MCKFAARSLKRTKIKTTHKSLANLKLNKITFALI